jgi:hypothetical protein
MLFSVSVLANENDHRALLNTTTRLWPAPPPAGDNEDRSGRAADSPQKSIEGAFNLRPFGKKYSILKGNTVIQKHKV